MKIRELSVPESVKVILEKDKYVDLYPPQEEAIRRGVLDGRNLVMAVPTASGKTLVAELCMIKSIIENGGKALYLVPLKALADEKYNEFEKYEKIGVRTALSTGDLDGSDHWLEKYDLIIATTEKVDSLIRHHASWIASLSTIIADEIHLINDHERGPTAEVVLARLMQLNPSAQIIALSATISNADEIGKWLRAELVTSEWRPVKLKEGVYDSGVIHFGDGETKQVGRRVEVPVIDLALSVVQEGGQVLVFTDTRKKSVNLATRIARYTTSLISSPENRALKQVSSSILKTGEVTKVTERLSELLAKGVAFHHAGLRYQERRTIEKGFRENKIKIVCATPTLAAGVNLPARMVIIDNYRRYETGLGYYPIPVLEYKQMAGRAGRPKYDKVGEAILIARRGEERTTLLDTYINGEPEKIWSKLGRESALRSHILSSIAMSLASDQREIMSFLNRTFYGYQYDPKDIEGVIEGVLEFLMSENMIKEVKGSKLAPTPFGSRISELYIDPKSAVVIRDGILSKKEKTILGTIHLICHTPDMEPIFLRRRDYKETEIFADESHGEFLVDVPDPWSNPVEYEQFLSEVKTARLLLSWMEEVPEDTIIENFDVGSGDIFRYVESADWLLYSTYEIAKLLNTKAVLPLVADVRERVTEGVKEELLELVKLKGIGRVRARMLYNAGFKTIRDLRNSKPSKLMSIPTIGPEVAKSVYEQVGATLEQSDWNLMKTRKTTESEQELLTLENRKREE
nr:ATP-dependent DNA helicase [Candidatus Njordarchaeota archaeon]